MTTILHFPPRTLAEARARETERRPLGIVGQIVIGVMLAAFVAVAAIEFLGWAGRVMR